MSNIFQSVALAITVLASATAGEPYYVPHGLDARATIRTFLTDYTKPNYVFAELAGAKLVQAHALLFRARVDDRPLVVDMWVIGSEINRGGTTEWLLMTFFRHPYGPRVGHTE